MTTVEKVTLATLKKHTQWVCFSLPDKEPWNPKTGGHAMANLPSTWGTFEQARRAFKNNPQKYAGVGYEFVKERGITGMDLDKCIDEHGQLSPFAQEVVRRINSYTETSPSGHGLRILVRGNIPASIGPRPKEDGDQRIEMNDFGKYYTITGNHLEGTPETIEDRQEELTALYNETITRRRQVATKPRTHISEMPRLQVGDTKYGLKALDDEYREIATMPEGGRNDRLNRAAYSLGQLVGGGELHRSTVERELTAAAERSGLGAREIEKTIKSGLEDGMKEPRTRPRDEVVDWTPEQPSKNGSNGHQPAVVTPEMLCKLDADDSGNGDALYALHGQDFLWCSARGWFRYNGTHWELDADSAEVRKRAVATLRKRRHAAVDLEKENIVKCTKADESRVNGCVSRFKTLSYVSIEEFDSNPDLLNCKNGVVDLRTGHIEPHKRDQRFTYCLPVAYGEADCTEWLEYLNGVVGGGQEVIDYLQLAAGYSLTGHTNEEILFYLHGPTRSGKGTWAEVFMALLPRPISTMVDFNSFTAKRDGDVSNFDLAPLKPSRIIFASESQKSQALNPAKIKQLTGGDTVTCSYKHKDFFTYRPLFKVWMLSNHPVNGDPEDDALWGRVRVIEFPHSFLGMEDKSKKARLKHPEALQGILYWAVQGAMKWYALGAKGLTTPAAIAETTKKHRDDLDYVQQWLDECSEDNEEGWVPNEIVSKSYTTWCKNNNVQYPYSPKGLAQSLKVKGYEPGKSKCIAGKTKRGVGGLYIYPEEGED